MQRHYVGNLRLWNIVICKLLNPQFKFRNYTHILISNLIIEQIRLPGNIISIKSQTLKRTPRRLLNTVVRQVLVNEINKQFFCNFFIFSPFIVKLSYGTSRVAHAHQYSALCMSRAHTQTQRLTRDTLRRPTPTHVHAHTHTGTGNTGPGVATVHSVCYFYIPLHLC